MSLCDYRDCTNDTSDAKREVVVTIKGPDRRRLRYCCPKHAAQGLLFLEGAGRQAQAKYHVGQSVWYHGTWGTDEPRATRITGIGKKNGRTVYDNDLGHWGYEDQYSEARLRQDDIRRALRAAARLRG